MTQSATGINAVLDREEALTSIQAVAAELTRLFPVNHAKRKAFDDSCAVPEDSEVVADKAKLFIPDGVAAVQKILRGTTDSKTKRARARFIAVAEAILAGNVPDEAVAVTQTVVDICSELQRAK